MDVPGFYAVAINPNPTVTLSSLDAVVASLPKSRSLLSPLAERARCLAILRSLQAECNPNDPEELFGLNRLGRAISRVESGE